MATPDPHFSARLSAAASKAATSLLGWGVAAGTALFIGRTWRKAAEARREQDGQAPVAEAPAPAVDAAAEQEVPVAPENPQASEQAEDMDLAERTHEELYSMAQEADISGRSRMNKSELVDALEGAEVESSEEAEEETEGEEGADEQAPGLEDKTRDELYAMAQDADITGRGSMNKAELLEALEDSAPAPDDAPNLADKTRDELYSMAQDADITGRSSMSKAELIEALENADAESE